MILLERYPLGNMNIQEIEYIRRSRCRWYSVAHIYYHLIYHQMIVVN